VTLPGDRDRGSRTKPAPGLSPSLKLLPPTRTQSRAAAALSHRLVSGRNDPRTCDHVSDTGADTDAAQLKGAPSLG